MGTMTAGARGLRGLLLAMLLAGGAVVAAAVGAVAADRFGDVAAGHAHEDGIGWVADAQVTSGCGDGAEYCPDDPVTRAQMATFLHRLSGRAAGVAPSVDAATVQGLTPEQLGADTAAITARLDALEDRLEELETDNAALEARVEELETDNAALQTLLAGVSRHDDPLGRDTLTFAGMNLQVVNGTGDTDGAPNGLGNLLVGYDAEGAAGSEKSGSHYLVVGDGHSYTAFGGLVAGRSNTASGAWASVSGGTGNTADGYAASVAGGQQNTADGEGASVSGGQFNVAGAVSASVSGGWQNTADDVGASVSGGFGNTASGTVSSVSGGLENTASNWNASVSGGADNTASGSGASILGGNDNTVAATDACHPGC